MHVSDYTYKLPEELIARFPPEERGTSRLLVLERASGVIEHKSYQDLAQYVQPGDVVVLNTTKVIKARLLANNTAGQPRELLLLEEHGTSDPKQRRALYKGKIREGEVLTVHSTPITINNVEDGGIAQISSPVSLLELAAHEGTVPLPPYLHRDATSQDIQRYQTVFAKEPGSVAAPTASLNFTEALQSQITANGTHIAYLTLHVGIGTFLPIRVDDITQHQMYSEHYEIPAATVQAIQSAKQSNHKVLAVGTTVTRTLEYAAQDILHSNPRTLWRGRHFHLPRLQVPNSRPPAHQLPRPQNHRTDAHRRLRRTLFIRRISSRCQEKIRFP